MRTYEDLNRTKVAFSEILETYSAKLKSTGRNLMLYIDTPFCMRACKFCNCRPYEAKCGGKEYNEYYPYLLDSIEQSRQLIIDHPPTDVYFGGGTPFFMDTQTMKNIFNAIPNFKEIPHKVMEGHPALLADSKLQLLIDNKFTYISLGVQTFNEEVLKNQNRLGFNFEQTKEKVKRLRDNGILVNCDIITYLDGVDKKSLEIFRRDLEHVKELEPDMITCYYDFYKLKVYQDENQNLVDIDKFTLDWVRRYRSEMVRFCRKNNAKLPVEFINFLDIEDIQKSPTYTTHIYLGDKRETHSYSCSGFPNFHPNEIALGLGGYGHHITYGHIDREFNYEMHLVDGEPVVEVLT